MDRKTSWISIVMIAALVAGCGGAGGEEVTDDETETVDDSGGELKIGYGTAAVGTLDPAKLAAQSEGNLASLVVEPLVAVGTTGEPEPRLATDWGVSDDLMTWTFTLRDDVTFSDGTPLDADAVKYSLDRVLDEETASPLASSLAAIEAVHVIDSQTVAIETSLPYSALPSALSYTPGAIVSPTAAEAAGLDEFGLAPVGTGPYVVESFTPRGELNLVRNEEYWGEAPSLARVSATFFQEEATLISSLQAGSTHIAWLIGPAQVEPLERSDDIDVVTGPGYTVTYLGFNTERPPFDQVEVRRAISHAIDLDAIHEVVLLGHATPTAGPVGPGMVGFNPDQEALAYDPELAEQLLADADVTDLTVDLYIPSDPVRERIASLMQQQLQSIGVGTNIVVNDFGAFLAAVNAGEEDAFMLQWSNGTGDADSAFASFQTGSGVNFTRFSSPEVDELIAQQKTEFDPDQRLTTIWETLDAIQEEAPWLPLWSATYIAGVRTEVNGFELTPSGNFDRMLASVTIDD